MWTSDDKKYKIDFWVGTYSSGTDGITVFSGFPSGNTVDPACSDTSPAIYEYSSFYSTDGGTTSKSYWQSKLPDSSGNWSCGSGGWGLLTLYGNSYWKDTNYRNLSSPPPPVHVRFTLKNLRSNTVVESPWVLVDASTLP